MADKKVHRAGDLSVFQSRLNYYQGNKSSFVVRSSGMTRKIEFASGTTTWRFFGGSKSSFIDGSYFAQMVKRSIDDYIERNGIPPAFDKPDIQLFNVAAIREHLRKPVAAIDINACHWTTAYHLGFINEELYQRGIASTKKKGLLVSIGSLNKLEQIDYYEAGQLVKTTYDYDTFNRYSPFYWAVIQRVRDVMMRCYEQLEDDMFMWLTDCVFAKFERREQIEQFFTGHGYKSKHYVTDFVKVDPMRVHWYEPKKQAVKFVGYQGRDIVATYALWKVNHV